MHNSGILLRGVPGPDCYLEQCTQPMHKDGGHELALSNIVVPDAERLCQDKGHRTNPTNCQNVMLQKESMGETKDHKDFWTP